MFLPRFRVRTLMIVVAVVATTFLISAVGWLLLFGETHEQVAAREYTERARNLRVWEQLSREAADGLTAAGEQFKSGKVPSDKDAGNFVRWKSRFLTIACSDNGAEIVESESVAAKRAEAAIVAYSKLSDRERGEWWVTQTDSMQRSVKYLSDLAAKYEAAARRPWLPLEPDPPPPE